MVDGAEVYGCKVITPTQYKNVLQAKKKKLVVKEKMPVIKRKKKEDKAPKTAERREMAVGVSLESFEDVHAYNEDALAEKTPPPIKVPTATRQRMR